jgi:hypothetical protein
LIDPVKARELLPPGKESYERVRHFPSNFLNAVDGNSGLSSSLPIWKLLMLLKSKQQMTL